MSKLMAFARLDFITVKPYFTVKNMLIYMGLAAFLTTMSGNLASAAGVGMLLGTMFMGYPFALSEKNDMDALYATLSVRRKTVVLGRYAFTLLLDVCASLLSVGLGAVGMLAMNSAGGMGAAGIALEIVLAQGAVFLVVQLLQMPVYFKFGYTRAKFLSLIPLLGLMASYMAILGLRDADGPPRFLMRVFGAGMALPLLAAALAALMFISYRLSISFYKKREF